VLVTLAKACALAGEAGDARKALTIADMLLETQQQSDKRPKFKYAPTSFSISALLALHSTVTVIYGIPHHRYELHGLSKEERSRGLFEQNKEKEQTLEVAAITIIIIFTP
jgi:hypothetical protein